MNINTSSLIGVAVLELSGRFDAYEVPKVKTYLEKIQSEARPKAVLNLGGVNFIDTTALASLVQGMKHCRQKNGDLYLCNLQQPVRIIFELTRLDRAFKIFQTQEEAVKAFAD